MTEALILHARSTANLSGSELAQQYAKEGQHADTLNPDYFSLTIGQSTGAKSAFSKPAAVIACLGLSALSYQFDVALASGDVVGRASPWHCQLNVW